MRRRPLPPSCIHAASALALLIVSGAATAQSPAAAPSSPKPASCSAADQSAGKCTPAPTARQQFPYPGDQPGGSAATDPDDPIPVGAASAPDSSSAPATPPDASAPAPSAPTSRKQFPYPGDPDPAAASSSSSSSSASAGSSSSSSADPDDPLDTPAAANATPGRRKLPKVKKLQNDEDREAEDVKVAKFYRDDGNNLAAYNRLRDATKLVTDDADAWYLLGDVAQKLHKADEASDAFRSFLALEPNTQRAKKLAKEQPQLNAKK